MANAERQKSYILAWHAGKVVLNLDVLGLKECYQEIDLHIR